MDKIRDTKKYIDTIKMNDDFFSKYYFHSLIDLNLVKLDLIMKYGILCKRLIQESGLIDLFTHDSLSFLSKNGNDYISLSQYTGKDDFNSVFSSFSLHVLSSISLLVDKSISVTTKNEPTTGFNDEIFSLYSISLQNIKGIILPEHISRLSISQVNCLPADLYCYTEKYISNWIDCMQKYFEKDLSKSTLTEIYDSIDQLSKIFRNYETPENHVQAAIRYQREQYGKDLKDILAHVLENLWLEKLSTSSTNYLDVLNIINDNRLPIYEIQTRGLKRIN